MANEAARIKRGMGGSSNGRSRWTGTEVLKAQVTRSKARNVRRKEERDARLNTENLKNAS